MAVKEYMRKRCCTIAVFTAIVLFCPGIPEAASTTHVDAASEKYRETQSDCLCSAELSMYTGIRRDRLNWHIAGNNVNILSELIVGDIDIFQVGAKSAFTKGAYTFFAEMAYGDVLGGTNVDRDFLANNRRNIYSESVADVSGRRAMDLSGGIGRNIDFHSSRYRLTPILGASWHRLRLLKTHGVQTIATPGKTPPLGAIQGLASTYDADWTGLWAGGNIRVQAAEALQIAASFRYQFFDFRADANWNLRQDLSHPVSFSHRATGRGIAGDVSYKWALTDRVDISLVFLYRYLLAKNGTDTTFFATGNKANTPLNKVSWRSRAITAGLTYRF